MVAADLGGTQIKSGLVAPDGTLTRATSTPTGRVHGWRVVVETLVAVVETQLVDAAATTGEAPVAVGIVVPGLVDEDRGVGVHSTNLGWRDVMLRELLGERLGLPVVVGQDVRAGGLAEAVLGAGRGAASTLFVPLGTGIGSAYVTNGRVDGGASWRAGEVGHIVVNPAGPQCACGQRGCLEALASASAIERRYAAIGPDRVTAEQVAARVRDGQPTAIAIWTDAVAALATGLAIATLLLDPAVVVVGGGLSRAGETLLGPLRTALADRFTFRDAPEIRTAALGEWAGCHGAGLLAARSAQAVHRITVPSIEGDAA